MQYDLVFEGGGAKGMALVGAYEELARHGHTHGRLLGTSAGAITAALIAAGYSSEDMLAALEEREDGTPVFSTFMGMPAAITEDELEASSIRAILRDIDLRFMPNALEARVDDAIAGALAGSRRLRHLFAFVERGGWFAADRFVAWLEAKLDSGTRDGEPRRFSGMTLAEFFAATASEVSFVASDTTDGRLLVLNHTTSPDCPLVWAVRMSMSIPFVWDEVVWRAEWGNYRQRDIIGHAIVDGGVLSNFPLELLISDEPFVIELMGQRRAAEVMGLLIDEALPVPTPRGLLIDVDIDLGELRTVQRIRRLANTTTSARDKMVIEAYDHLVVRLPAQGYGTTEFDMTEERRIALVDGGRVAMRDYLATRPAPATGTRGVDDTAATPPTAPANRVATRLLGSGA